jgi:alpha-beta hydrolase superfamily lysophospholipase
MMPRIVIVMAIGLAAYLAARADAATASFSMAFREASVTLAQSTELRETERSLRGIIHDLQQGTPDWDGMEEELRHVVQSKLAQSKALIEPLGALDRVEFVGVQNGADVYRVIFRNGMSTWVIALSPQGRIATLFFRLAPGLETAGEDVTAAGLSATLLKPPGREMPPVVLLIAGSGPTDRNGNQSGTGPGELRQIAEELAARGIASLRYDKRGVTRSLSAHLREEELDFRAAVDDAGIWLGWLERRSDLGARIVIGHSEGGLVAILLAKRALPAGLVLLATPGRALGDVLRDQIAAIGWAPAMRDEALTTIAALERGESVDKVSAPLMPLLRPSVQPFLRSLLGIDPAREISGLHLPPLVVSGGRDLQVGDADTAAIRRARPDASYLHVPDMIHVLKLAPVDRAEQMKVMADPAAPLAPGLIDAITAFVRRCALPDRP